MPANQSMIETHSAVAVGLVRPGKGGVLHHHTAEFLCTSGTGSATIIHYGRNDPASGWYAICTFTFTGAANAERAVQQTLEHNYTEYRIDCTAITGTGAKVVTTMSGV